VRNARQAPTNTSPLKLSIEHSFAYKIAETPKEEALS
jgi:hypothetical protein